MKLVIDSSYLGYRAFYKVQDLSWENLSTGVIFGFMGEILALAEKFNPEGFIFCFDSKNSYRSLVFPEYKLNRKSKDVKTPEDQRKKESFYSQMGDLRNLVLPNLQFKNLFQQSGYEADDLIAHVVQRFPDDYLIVASDEDLFQLLYDGRSGQRVRIYNYNRIMDEASFRAEYQIEPLKWAQVKAIAGCTSDGIPGIERIGVKTAISYLLGEAKETAVQRINEGRGIIERNFPLVALPFNGKKRIAIEGLKEDDLWASDFRAVFGQWGFRSFLKEERFEKWKRFFRLSAEGEKNGERG